MKLETLSDYSSSKLRTSSVTPSYAGKDLLAQVSRQTSRLAEDSFNEWQQATIADAAAKGAVAGRQENVTYQDGNTLTAQAFNRAAVQSVTNNLTFQTTIGMNTISQEYANDPAKYKEKSDAFIESTVTGLRESEQTKALAQETENKMKLTQQRESYKIDKTYMANQMSKIKADTEILSHDIKVEAFKTAGGVFSEDETEQNLALNSFSLSKNMLESSLRTVTPDGAPVYTPEAVQKRLQTFHTGFYTTAVQSWVSEANLNVEDLVKIRTGTLAIKIPGTDKEINILEQIGQEAYESKVIKYSMQKLRDKQTMETKITAQDKLAAKEDRNVADVELISSIYDGSPVTSNSIIQMLKDGKINKVAANSAIKMLQNPEAETNDEALYTNLMVQQIQGNLPLSEIPEYASVLSKENFNELLIKGAKANKTMQSEDEKWIVREMIKKDRYGMDDPKSVRLASDMVDRYRQSILDGNSIEFAMEQSRTTIDAFKERANKALFNSVPKYTVIKEGTIDPLLTAMATAEARKKGKITAEVYKIEMLRLNALMNERRGGK